ncbi:PTS cellobiose transporter subunit IIC [Brochothrix campestris]|uniref:Permease IIC component n=1 Tax=Brochothrix campestris FSL F6-1037 TaxID=1265861 RepID=W7D226_9LIST|nr:PTS cellobiose transporter subunit IIC [Brochothrix campestris]EUJ41996.1 PTS system cellobiose-specific transporter subunit IIC [Brochothrix campestris FSL F6-1037]
MNKYVGFLASKLAPLGIKLGTQKHLVAIRDGIVYSMPLVMIGSLFLIISNLPIPGYSEFLNNTSDLMVWFNKIVDGSFGAMGLVASFSIAYSLAHQYKIDGISTGIISLSSFLIVTPNILDSTDAAGVPLLFLGSRGLFIAMLIGLLSAEIFRWFVKKNIRIKMPDSVPPAVSQSFSALIPGFAIILFFALIYQALNMFDITNIHDLILIIFNKPLTFLGGTLFGTMIAVSLNSIFWFIGLHGGNIVGSVMGPIWLMNTDDNRIAFQAGKEMPHIFTSTFTDAFVYIGGGGAIFALVFLLFFFSKSKEGKTMGKLSFFPDIFNVGEPAMFGIPIVMKPILFLPFVLAPMANTVIAYIAMSSGLVAKTVGIAIPWTTPPLISGYLATGGDITGSILQVVIIVIDILIYFPFFKMLDNEKMKIESFSKGMDK